jgi:hypothetical protein
MKAVWTICWLVAPALAGWAAAATAAGAASPKPRALPAAVEERSLVTLEPSPMALMATQKRVVMVPADKGIGVEQPFKGPGASRVLTFGELTDGKRLPIAPDAAGRPWRGIDEVGNKLVLLDGEDLTMLEADGATMKEVTRRTVPRDLLRPARDPRGEPSSVSINALRARFKTAFLATPAPRITGMAPLPDAWLGADKRRYLLATRVKDFPLLLMACDREDPSSCAIERRCNLEGGGDLAAEHVTGIAVSEPGRTVLIGDDAHGRIVEFRFNSCYDVPRRGELRLPERLKRLTTLAVDGAGRLWVATAQADDYLNASVYFWAPAAWR